VIRIPMPIIIWSCIGSLGAMLYRFNDSADAELADPLRWSFTRPLTGVLMGIIAYMVFKIGLLVLQPGTAPGTPGGVGASQELLWLAAFLAGFSDRFADSVLRSLAGRLGGEKHAELQSAEQTLSSTGASMKALAEKLGWGKSLAEPAFSKAIQGTSSRKSKPASALSTEPNLKGTPNAASPSTSRQRRPGQPASP